MFKSDSDSTHFSDDEENTFPQTLHPLLTPIILQVLFHHLNNKDAVTSRLVCRTWNTILRKKIIPLLYKPVFRTLLKYLPKESVYQCRLVCSIWNASIVDSKRWTRKGVYRRGEEHDTFFRLKYATGFIKEINAKTFQRFHEKFGQLLPLPLPLAFRHFTATATSTLTMNEPYTLEFLRLYGNHIKCLHLKRAKWTFKNLRRILFELCPNVEHFKLTCGMLPGTGSIETLSQMSIKDLLHVDPESIPILSNLKSLTLSVDFLNPNQTPRPFIEEFLLQLLKSCPNLEIFDCDVECWYTRTWALDFICRNEGVPLNRFRGFVSLVEPDSSQMERICLRKLPLASLDLRIQHENVTVEVLHNLLRSLKNTLVNLRLTFLTHSAAHEFPSAGDLQKLKYFHLWSFRGQLGFLKEMKSLEILSLDIVDFPIQHEFINLTSFKPLIPSLKKLVLPNVIYAMDRNTCTYQNYVGQLRSKQTIETQNISTLLIVKLNYTNKTVRISCYFTWRFCSFTMFHEVNNLF